MKVSSLDDYFDPSNASVFSPAQRPPREELDSRACWPTGASDEMRLGLRRSAYRAQYARTSPYARSGRQVPSTWTGEGGARRFSADSHLGSHKWSRTPNRPHPSPRRIPAIEPRASWREGNAGLVGAKGDFTTARSSRISIALACPSVPQAQSSWREPQTPTLATSRRHTMTAERQREIFQCALAEGKRPLGIPGEVSEEVRAAGATARLLLRHYVRR
jgi:hypothetical protein